MQGARMLWISRENIFHDGRRTDIRTELTPAMTGSQQRQRIKHRGFVVVRVAFVQTAHCGGVRKIAILLLAISKDNPDGA